MRIIKPATVRDHMATHPTSRASLSMWLALAGRAEWQSVKDVRQPFPHADAVTVGSGRTVVVFNIGGNNFRLIAAVDYDTRRIHIREFLTHAEHDRDTWKGRH